MTWLLHFLKPNYILGALLVMVCTGFYFYYNITKNEINDLLEKNAKLDVANKLCTETLKVTEENYKFAQTKLNKLNSELNKIRRQHNDALKRLKDYQLSVKAIENPKQVEEEINTFTRDLTRCFELITGESPKENEVNSQCSEVLNNVKK